MQIEEGKFYRTRDGQKEGPIQRASPNNANGGFPWKNGKGLWFSDDGLAEAGDDGARRPGSDLIAEWTDAPEPAKAGLPDTMKFVDVSKDAIEVCVAYGKVVVGRHAFTPERARALAAALMAYADQAEGST